MPEPRESIAPKVPFAVTHPEDRMEPLAGEAAPCWLAIKNFGPGSVEVITSRGEQRSLVPTEEDPPPLILHPGSEIELFKETGESVFLSLNPVYGSEPASGWYQRRGELQTS